MFYTFLHYKLIITHILTGYYNALLITKIASTIIILFDTVKISYHISHLVSVTKNTFKSLQYQSAVLHSQTYRHNNNSLNRTVNKLQI